MERVELVRYPGPRADTRSLEPPYGLVVRVRTDAGAVAGAGEAVVGHRDLTPAWAELERLAAQLVGSTLPARLDPARPLDRISHWRQLSPDPGRSHRAARLAIELALLDLLMKSIPRSPAQLWGSADHPGQSRFLRPVRRLPKAMPAPAWNELVLSWCADSDESAALRVRSTGDPRLDTAWLRRLAEARQSTGAEQPLWLVGRGRLSQPAAEDFVRKVAGMVAKGALPSRVLLEEPAKTGDVSALCRLQAVADDALGRPGQEPGAPRLTVLAGRSIGSPAHLREITAAPGRIGGVCLSVARWGTWLGVREAAQAVAKADPSVLVQLTDEPMGSDITATAIAALHAATPEIDGSLLATSSPTGWPRLLDDAAAEAELAEPSSRAGMFAGLDLVQLATVADRLCEVPRPGPGPGGEEPNQYGEFILPGAPLGLPKQTILELEALCAGLRTKRFTRRLFLAEHRESPMVVGFSGPQSSGMSVAAAAIATNKGLTRDLLAEHGLPIAPGGWFPAAEVEKVRALADELGFPLVVKPADGVKGRGVTPGISSMAELNDALGRIVASGYGSGGIVLERMVTGTEYRVLTTPTGAISMYRRQPGSVVGDGHHTIEELVLAANVLRRQNPQLGRRLIRLDDRAEALLRRQGRSTRSVPAAGERVRLSMAGNLNLGGSNREVLDAAHPSVLALAAAAVAAIPGLPYGGVDLFLEDHTRPVGDQDVTIIEINHNPGLMGHHYPMFGPGRNVCGRLLTDLAAAEGVTLPAWRDPLTIKLTVVGLVQGVGYRQWMARAAEQLGLSGWVRNAEQPDRVHAVVHGPAPRVGVLLRLAFGGPARSQPIETIAEPGDAVPISGFVIEPEGAGSGD